MGKRILTDAEFIERFETLGTRGLMRETGMTERGVLLRRARLEQKYQRQLTPPQTGSRQTRNNIQHPHRSCFDIQDGIVLVGSDAHLWPGPASTAFRAFVKFCKDLKPKAVILNGDVLDFPQISRHPPIGWQNHPTVQEEIEAAQDKLAELEGAAFRAKKIWTLGNHCQRYETRLATVAPEYVKLKGYSLKDWFPLWEPCWSSWINPDRADGVVVKHRFKGGIGATRANTLHAGRHMFTGHLHSANVRGFTDYNGTRWGVDTGCLADPSHQAFIDYTEDAPLDWRSAFAVLTFHKSQLMQPELALKWDANHVQFRGDLIKV